MKRSRGRSILIWTGAVAGGLAGVAVAAALVIHLLGEREFGRYLDVPLTDITVTSEPALVAAGERLAHISGCTGCHGSRLEGQVFFDAGWIMARAVASNLSVVTRQYSDAELLRALRFGVNREGRALVGMPSEMYFHLSDADLASIIAYVRHVPAVDNPLPATWVGPLGRLGILTGKFHTAAALVAEQSPRLDPPEPGDALALGRYLAQTSCSECHGSDFMGVPEFTPPLVLVAAYDEAAFQHFMHTGEATGGRELRLMSQVARARFSHFTDEELVALYRYLLTLVEPD